MKAKPQGKANLVVNSVSSVGKPKLKRTGIKTLDTAARRHDLEKKAEASKRVRTQQQDANDTPLASLASITDYGRVERVTLPNGKQREFHTISPTAMAEPLLTNPVTISRWLKAGLLPNPVLESGRTLCYHIEEARSFCQILGEHLTETKHYRSSHTATKERLFKENARIRDALIETK